MSGSDACDHYARQYAALDHGAEPAWLAALRRDAMAAFRGAGFPHTRLEEWRYTNVAPIERADFELAAPPPRPVGREDLESHAFPVFACSVYVFVNGRFAPELSAGHELPGGARVESLRALRERGAEVLEGRLGALADVKQNAFTALNTAFVDDGAVVHVPERGDAGQPIHLVFVQAPTVPTDAASVVHPRVLVVAERESRVSLVQDHVCVGNASGFTNPVTEIHAGEGASVDLVLIQRESDQRFHVSNLAVRQERSSLLSVHTLSLGGALVRNDASSLLAGEGACCDLSGLFVGAGHQVVDNHTLVDHAVPHCTSRELYKGILGGASRGVFRGRVIVRPDAQKTVASQKNPNLLIGRRAEVDTKPQLEIHADDVKCSHGSTIGQIDEAALFYLRSRGIAESRARDLLTRAFGLEILESLPSPALAEALDEIVLERLRYARLEEAA